jgi:hypothetical protein
MTDFRTSCAYFLEVNEKDKKYIEGNRRYKYIGYHTGSISDIVSDPKEWKRFYLYDDASVPCENVSNMKQYIQKKDSLTKGLQRFEK